MNYYREWDVPYGSGAIAPGAEHRFKVFAREPRILLRVSGKQIQSEFSLLEFRVLGIVRSPEQEVPLEYLSFCDVSGIPMQPGSDFEVRVRNVGTETGFAGIILRAREMKAREL